MIIILKYNEYYFIEEIYQLKENYLYFPKTEKNNSLNNDQKKQKAVSSVIHKKRHEEIWLHYARL